MTEKNFDIVQKIQDFVDARGKTMIELAFSLARGTAAGLERDRRSISARAGRAKRQSHQLEADG